MIKETGETAISFVGKLAKTAAQPFTNTASTIQTAQDNAADTLLKAVSDALNAVPSLPTRVNWLKDDSMLPRSLPRARIL
jgi:hypothetical protein